MGVFEGIGLRLENYKSFGPGLTGFDSIAPINLIVGRNNSGKSALLDLVLYACNQAKIPNYLGHQGASAKIVVTLKATESAVSSVFRRNTSHGLLRGDHWEIGSKLVGAQISIDITGKSQTLVNIEPKIDRRFLQGDITDMYNNVAANSINPFKGKLFYKLAAERDIVLEQIQSGLKIGPTGQGFTSTVSQILNQFDHPTKLVSDELLAAINEVFSPDASFTSIDVQQHGDNGPWEIFLDEAGKGRVGLTHSGSGLKTVLLAAGYFLLLPHIAKKPLSDFIFAFEELENNLHPALQRRLLKFVAENAKKHGTLLFLTTHSNVVIDLFSNDKDAQIIHVTQAAGKSKARRVQTYIQNRGVLDDLDVRASDLLQANGIAWVEGPSDRLYFNRWIELVSDGQLKEGTHYQCVFYGGRLLAHLSADIPDLAADEAVRILRVNRNALILIDSDKSDVNDELNATKRRIISEIERLEGMAWVTQGRDVENYLSLATIQSTLPNAPAAPAPFGDFAEYLDSIEPGAGRRFERNKVLFAESLIPSITKEDLSGSLDLVDRLGQAAAMIRKWNGIH